MDSLPFAEKAPISSDDFERLLRWLSADRDLAGDRYEYIRRSLIRIFRYRNAAHPEELADETINRVLRKLAVLIETYSGDPALYFYGVANQVHREYVKAPVKRMVPQRLSEDALEPEMSCLEECLGALDADTRALILRYYSDEKRGRIDGRQMLAEQLGLSQGGLRVRAHRIRREVEKCVTECVRRETR